MLLPCPKCQIVGVKTTLDSPKELTATIQVKKLGRWVDVGNFTTREEALETVKGWHKSGLLTHSHYRIVDFDPTTLEEPLPVKTTESIDDTLKARGSRYGEFRDNARISQALQEVLERGVNYQETNQVHREALKFICQKMSRIVNGDPDYVDNWHDITGYATLAEKECK